MATPASSTDPTAWLQIDGAVIPWDDGVSPPQEVTVLEEYLTVIGGNREWLIEPIEDAPRRLEISIDGEVLPPRQGAWYWRPEGSAGRYRLDVRDPTTGATRHGWVRVLPTTVSYAHYQVMLAEIQAIAYHLVFQTTGGARESLALTNAQTEMSVGLVEYHKLAQLMPTLAGVMNTLRRDPRETLAVRTERVPIGTAAFFQLDPPFEPIAAGESLPREITAFRTTPSLNVYENQLVRHLVVERLPTKLRQICGQLSHEIEQREASRQMAEQSAIQAWTPGSATGWRRRAQEEWTQIQALSPLLQQVYDWQQSVTGWARIPCVQMAGRLRQQPQPTPTLTREPRYRKFYQLYLAFNRDLRLIDLSQLNTLLSTRKQWELYEMWSVLTLTQRFREVLLAAGFQQYGTTGLYRVQNNTFEIKLDRGCVLEFRRGDARIRIAYERLYESFKQVNRQPDILGTRTHYYLTPDLAIEAYLQNNSTHLLIIDAKYKHNEGVAIQKDISKVQRDYVVSLGLANPKGGKPLNVDSRAIVAFPGSVPNLPEDADAGALPLQPGGPASHLDAYVTLFESWMETIGVK